MEVTSHRLHHTLANKLLGQPTLKGRGFLGGRGTPESQPPTVHLGNLMLWQHREMEAEGDRPRGASETTPKDRSIAISTAGSLLFF